MVDVVDPERFPFMYLTIEQDWTKEQVNKIFDLMDEVHKSLSTSKKIGAIEFERQVGSIVPGSSYENAKSILLTFADQDKYMDVYEHLRKDGLNVRERRDT